MCNQHRKSPADMIEHANATCKFASPLSSSSVARSSLTKRTVRVISRMALARIAEDFVHVHAIIEGGGGYVQGEDEEE